MLSRFFVSSTALMHKPLHKNKLAVNIQHAKLFGLFHSAYRPNAKYRNGSTADAVRHEMATGELLSSHSHLEKAITMRDRLSLLIGSGELHNEERNLARFIRDDLQRALTEQSWDKVLVGRKKL
ncbi:MAG: hypothetical protein ACYC0J_03920 [Gammaproteobacteria bacterium]